MARMALALADHSSSPIRQAAMDLLNSLCAAKGYKYFESEIAASKLRQANIDILS